MKKDPAFLFYSSDFLTGTMLMNNEEIGAYIKLLCLQHQQGHLEEKDVLSISNNSDKVKSKFKKDIDLKYYNERLDEEVIKRKIHGEKQRENVMKRWNKRDTNVIPSYYQNDTKTIPLEDEDEDVNKDINIYDYISRVYNRILSSIEIEIIQEYLIIFNEDVIKYAIDLSIMNDAPRINYVKAILNNWKASKYKTLEEIKTKEKIKPIKKSTMTEEQKKLLEEMKDYNWLEESEKE